MSPSPSSPAAGSETAPVGGVPRPSPAPCWFLWVAGFVLLAYAVFLGVNTTVVAGGSDSSGYLNAARLFAAGKFRTELRVPAEFGPAAEVNPRHFSPQGFNLFAGNPELAPTYPTGLPLHLALAGRLAGWWAGPFAVELLAAVGAVLLLYGAAREIGIGFELAAAGAVMLAAFPVFIFTSIQTLSDTLATTWMLAAFYAGLRARAAAGWAVACGAALAVAVLVRPTNLVLAPALALLVGRNPRLLGGFVLGGLPGAAWLAFYNHHLYGGVLRSGYGNYTAAFSLDYGWPTAVHFAKWLAILLPAVVLLLPLAALTRRETRHREFFALALGGLAVVGIYLFYDVSQEVWWCLRFILPGCAALILAALVGAEALARGVGARWPRAFRPVVALGLALWAGAISWFWTPGLGIFYVPEYENAYADMAEVVKARLPANAIVICSVFSGALYYATPLPSLVYDSITPPEFARYIALARQGGRPIYAVIFDIEEEEVLQQRCPGPWKRIATVRKIGIWQLQ